MKKNTFIALFIGTHITFIVLHISQQSTLIKSTFQKQKNEIVRSTLVQKKQALTQQLCSLHNKTSIKEFAIATLHMEPIQLNQIKPLQ